MKLSNPHLCFTDLPVHLGNTRELGRRLPSLQNSVLEFIEDNSDSHTEMLHLFLNVHTTLNSNISAPLKSSSFTFLLHFCSSLSVLDNNQKFSKTICFFFTYLQFAIIFTIEKKLSC